MFLRIVYLRERWKESSDNVSGYLSFCVLKYLVSIWLLKIVWTDRGDTGDVFILNVLKALPSAMHNIVETWYVIYCIESIAFVNAKQLIHVMFHNAAYVHVNA